MDERIVAPYSVSEAIAMYYKQNWNKRGMRLGQWLINRLAPLNTKAPDIFYEEDSEAAIQLFIERYVQDQEDLIN